jgi:hypothetical protein
MSAKNLTTWQSRGVIQMPTRGFPAVIPVGSEEGLILTLAVYLTRNLIKA